MKLRGGLIGCGYISELQLRAWEQIESAEIVAVCDLDLDKAHRRAREFRIPKAYAESEAMLTAEKLDFVDIATRPSSHIGLVSEAAARGLAVLCQKPLADSLQEAREIVNVCEEAGVHFMVNENGRHQAWFRKLKELIDGGTLGTLHNARFESRWRSTLPEPDFEGQDYFREMPKLFVFEMGVHYLDTARYLFGEATSVYARLKRVSPHIAGDDMALVVVGFGELTCVVDGNFYSHPEPGENVTWGPVRIEGTAGTAVLGRDGSLAVYGDGEPQRWQFPEETIDQSFLHTQQHFIDCLRTGRESETSGEQSLKTMALVFAAYQSSEENRVIAIGP
jgi:predicted dehydrogenase